MKIEDFKDLRIWQLGIEVVEDTYKITKTFPAEEHYGLSGQMRRAATSIPSNIAEGFARKNSKEYKQFLYISCGSCAELQTQVEIAYRLKYISSETKEMLLAKMVQWSKMTMTLIKCL